MLARISLNFNKKDHVTCYNKIKIWLLLVMWFYRESLTYTPGIRFYPVPPFFLNMIGLKFPAPIMWFKNYTFKNYNKYLFNHQE